MVPTLNFGVVGTGGIAADFVESLRSSTRCRVVNVVGTSSEKARAFRDAWQLPRSSDHLELLLSDPEVEAVYIASPHPAHAEHAMTCLRARKAVLCEKPLSMDASTSRRVIEVARAERVFLMEAFMYRCHPLM